MKIILFAFKTLKKGSWLQHCC